MDPPHMAVQKQDDQHEHTFSNYVRIQDVVPKNCLRRWMIGKSGERGSGISVLPAWHDDDHDDNNLTTKPYKPYKTLPSIGILNSFVNSYIFIVCSIWCKTLFIVVVVYKFCCTKSRSSPFFKSCHQFPTAVEVRFILLQNVGTNWAFRGL